MKTYFQYDAEVAEELHKMLKRSAVHVEDINLFEKNPISVIAVLI